MVPRNETTAYRTTVVGKPLWIYVPDHPPPHAHVLANKDKDGELQVNLFTLTLLDKYAYNRAALRDAPEILRAMVPLQAELLLAWHRLNPKIH